MLDSTSRYPIYVLGINDEGEEVFVIVPVLESQEPYIVDWPFIKSFEEIVQQLNDSYIIQLRWRIVMNGGML